MANAYTASSDLNTLPKYYEKVFLERLQPGPILMDYCMQFPLPQGAGTTILFPRLAVSSTTPSAYKLTQGTIISTEKVVDTQISAVIEQFGNAKALTDIAQLTALNTLVAENIKEIGDQANNIIDKRIRDDAYGTSSVPWGGGFSITAFNTNSKSDLGASTSAYFTYVGTSEYTTTAASLRYLSKKLKSRNVRPFDDGFYVLVCHSDTAMGIQADSTWQAALKLVQQAVMLVKKTQLNSVKLPLGQRRANSQKKGVTTYEQSKNNSRYDYRNGLGRWLLTTPWQICQVKYL